MRIDMIVFFCTVSLWLCLTGCGGGGNGDASTETASILDNMGGYLLDGFSSEMALYGDRAMIVNSDNSMTSYEIHFIDITDPTSPVQEAIIKTSHRVTSIALSNDKAWFSEQTYQNGTWAGSIHEVSLSNFAIARSLEIEAAPNAFLVNNEYGYIVDQHGLRVLDMNDFTLAETPLVGSPSSYVISIDGERAYVGGQYNAIDIFDISMPATPLLLGSFSNPFEGSPHGMITFDSFTAIAAGGIGIAVFDTRLPLSITLKAIQDTEGWAESIAIDGHYCYLADGESGLLVIDISNMTAPVVKGTYDLGGYARRVIHSGNHVCVLLNEKGLVIFEKKREEPFSPESRDAQI